MHISLDSALGRQRRLNSVGESVLQIAPNAAAAYSLRSLTGGDPRVVRVRRASDNGERDFTSSEITSGTLLAFVNESITASYNAEDGSLSGLSRVDFDGSSTTLSNVSSGALGGTRSFKVDITSGTSTNTSYPRIRRSTGGDLALFAGLQYRFKCKIKLTSGSARVRGRLGTSGSNNAFNFQTLQVGQLVEIDETFTPTATINSNNIEFVFDGTFGEGTILLDDIELTALTSDGFVETWYDQSGNSEDAVQATAGSQPKIVNAGSLVVDSAGLPEIDFDGSNDCLTASSYSRSGEDLPLTMISVFDQDVAGVDYVVSINQTNNNAFDRILLRTDSFDYGRRATDNAAKDGSGSDPDVNTKYVFTAINAGTTSSGFVDGSSIFSGVDTNVGTQALDQIDIGANNGDSNSNSNPFDGQIQEIIIYETDQSDNRLALEANIMTNYGIS